MKLTSLFVHRPTLVFVLLALVTVAGSLAWVTLVRQQFPNVSQPTVSVSVNYNGASPTVMRDSIVRPIEDQVAGQPDLQTLSSTIQGGSATISATFTLNSDVNTDLVNVQKAVQSAQRSLPTDLTSPVVSVRDPSESVVVTLSLNSSSLTASQLSLYATGRIIPAFQQVAGVSNVTAGGSVTPAYEVTVDPTKLLAHNLTLTDVVNTVSANNIRAPGGIAYQANRETNVDIRGDISSPESILGLAIAPPAASAAANAAGGIFNDATVGAVNAFTSPANVLRISDVASVSAGYEPRRQFASVNGINGLFLQVQKASQASEVDASNNVIAALPRIKAQFPEINFSIINVQSKYTAQQLDGVVRTLIEGVVLTGLVMLFFLHSWRNAVVVLIAIPASLGVSLAVMKMLGLTLDTISLLGMTLVVGILVDDSTVVLENIERHHEMGEDPIAAAISGRAEIGIAAIVITLVDVVVFLPIAFIQSQVGRQLAEFGIVVVISTLTSLFISFTVTPSLAANWALRSKWRPWGIITAFSSGFDRVRSWYAHRVLPWGLKNRLLVIAFSVVSFIAAVSLIPLGVIGKEFIPAQDRGEIYVQVQFPIGTPLKQTTSTVLALERAIRKSPDIDADTASSGAYSAPFGGFVSQGNVGQVHVWLKDNRQNSTDYWVQQFRQTTRRALRGIPNVVTSVVPATGTGGGNAQPLAVILTDVAGGDPTKYANQVFAALQQTPGAVSAISSSSQLEPQVELTFDRAKAQALDVSIGTASTAARAAFGGAIATQFETADGLEQVEVIYPSEKQTSLADLANIPIRSSSGAIVHLGDFSSFQWAPVSPLITRQDRNTVINISSNIAPTSSLSNVEAAFKAKVAALHLPPNIQVRPKPLGQQDLMGQALLGLGTSLILSVLLVFLLMVALYNSYRAPFIIMFAVPVAAVGAVGALWITHSTLNLFSLIGSILLVGIVTKNGILLVDYANTLRDRGEDKLTAIQESAFTRFRPIIMTSISVIAGNIPLALALEPGSSVRSSLGVVVIGGISSSLVLTLVLVPIMYMFLAPAHHVAKTPEKNAPGSAAQDALPSNVPHDDAAPVPAHA